MAHNLLNRLLNNELELKGVSEWLFKLVYEDPQYLDFVTKHRCSRSEFITFFLNFVHEEIGCSYKKNESLGKRNNEINKSHSLPSDLSVELNDSLINSTPKINKVSSECVLSPLSPIYKNHKSPICLGDFMVTKRASSKKKPRRIKPTELQNSVHVSENSFNFNKSEPSELPCDRNGLVEERLKILERGSKKLTFEGSEIEHLKIGCSKKLSQTFYGTDLVGREQQIDKIVHIYTGLLNNNFILNLTSEIYFLISLLVKTQSCDVDWGVEVLSDKLSASNLFTSTHNVVYFAAKTLNNLYKILRNYDKSTVRLLAENECLHEFAPNLTDSLRKLEKCERVPEVRVVQNTVCFNSDTDNRQNFPNDPSFHAFRKQRDMFYEILRLWEEHHPSPGFSFSVNLGAKIRNLLSLYNEPTNFIHFARLFKTQLLSTCRIESCEHFLTSLDVDAQKLSKLRNRCVSKGNSHGLNSAPGFTENEEFYKEFVLVGANQTFNRHFADALIEEISELNDTNFNNNDTEEYDVDIATKKSYSTCISSLRVLAKFLGFVESLPYQADSTHYTDHLLATHLKIRSKVSPVFDVKLILQKSIKKKSVILCVPWLVTYLSMLDAITLKLPYYVQVHHNLFWLYRHFSWGPDCNLFLIKFCLGWLFELPHMPNNDYIHYCELEHRNVEEQKVTEFVLDRLEIVDQNILYVCCPYLEEIKKLLTTNTVNSVSIKHITPVTALQSPDEVVSKKLEQQLEEAFFNGQPVSLRKTVEFVSERVASTCVKHICATVVPGNKKESLEKFKQSVKLGDDVDNQKVALRAQATEYAAICAKQLQNSCLVCAEKICSDKIPNAMDSLLALDVLPQTKQVCVGITHKSCVERVKQWINSHVTAGIFSKDFNEEIQKITSFEVRKARPVFVLPPGGAHARHNRAATSASHLLDKYTDMIIRVVEHCQITENDVTDLLDETSKSISERADINQCILATICTQLLDLFVLLIAHDWTIVSQDGVLSKSCDIWRLYYNGCDDLFKSLMCPRNVRIFNQSRDTSVAWHAFAKFCVYLMKNQMLSCDNFEAQCTAIFRNDWDQGTLKCISDFFKACVDNSDFSFLLQFLADYCEDL